MKCFVAIVKKDYDIMDIVMCSKCEMSIELIDYSQPSFPFKEAGVFLIRLTFYWFWTNL